MALHGVAGVLEPCLLLVWSVAGLHLRPGEARRRVSAGLAAILYRRGLGRGQARTIVARQRADSEYKLPGRPPARVQALC